MSRAWYPMYWGDWTADTSHLTMLEIGAYNRLLARVYVTEKPLPSDINLLFRICGARNPQERKAVNNVLSEFFTLSNGLFTNLRASRELQIATAHSKVQSTNAKKRYKNQQPEPAIAVPSHNDGRNRHVPNACQNDARARVPQPHKRDEGNLTPVEGVNISRQPPSEVASSKSGGNGARQTESEPEWQRLGFATPDAYNTWNNSQFEEQMKRYGDPDDQP